MPSARHVGSYGDPRANSVGRFLGERLPASGEQLADGPKLDTKKYLKQPDGHAERKVLETRDLHSGRQGLAGSRLKKGYCPGGSRKITSCGLSVAGNGAPPAPENWIDTVAADAGVSILKYDEVPGSSKASERLPLVIGKKKRRIGERNVGRSARRDEEPVPELFHVARDESVLRPPAPLFAEAPEGCPCRERAQSWRTASEWLAGCRRNVGYARGRALVELLEHARAHLVAEPAHEANDRRAKEKPSSLSLWSVTLA